MKIFIIIFLLSRIFGFTIAEETVPMLPVEDKTIELYLQMRLNDVLNYAAFEYAVTGVKKIDPAKRNILSIMDLSKPSTEERFFVIDIENCELLYSSHVAHGEKSGVLYAESFSNKVGSHQTSLGFYLTAETYKGKYGTGLRLDGLEAGFNDKARERAVVIHSSKYSDPSVIGRLGRLGRSQGCPALPPDMAPEIIDVIKEGSVLFVYAENEEYLNLSEYIPKTVPLS